MPAVSAKKSPPPRSVKRPPSRRAVAASPEIIPSRDFEDREPLVLHPRGNRLLTKRQVLELTGLTFPTLWTWMREGTFPRARQLGSNRVCWIESEIAAWIPSRPLKEYKRPTPPRDQTGRPPRTCKGVE